MNDKIFFFFYNFAHQSYFTDGLITFFSQYFQYLVILAAMIFLIFHNEVFSKEKSIKELFQKLKEIFFVSCSVILAWLFSILLKIIFLIPRPFLTLGDVQPVLLPNGFSFPSGHSAFFMALAVAIFLYHKKIGYLFIFFALLIGLSRVVAGVHYPFDILGGYLFGGLISYILVNFSKNKS